jgi:hypothetical protein
VGASGWDYRVPHVGNVEQTLIAAQEQVLAGGDYIWPWGDLDPGEFDDDILPRPRSLTELEAARETDEFWEEGTHSILDIDRIISTDSDEVGAIRPLNAAELTQVFGTEHPSATDFDRVYRPGPAGPLEDLLGDRWCGRSMVIFRDGTPDEVFFWGCSGD